MGMFVHYLEMLQKLIVYKLPYAFQVLLFDLPKVQKLDCFHLMKLQGTRPSNATFPSIEFTLIGSENDFPLFVEVFR